MFSAQTHVGLSLFIAAIFLNMICSETMCWLEKVEKKEDTAEGNKKVQPAKNSGWRKKCVPILMIATAVLLGCSWCIPFMHLESLFLTKMSYSILNEVKFMFQDKECTFSLIVVFFCIVMPVVKLASIAMLWYREVPLKDLENHNEIVKGIGKWSMPDVFWFGLVIFLLASDNILPGVKGSIAIWFLFVYIICNYALDIIVHSHIEEIISTGKEKPIEEKEHVL
jgi:uncharacterized paraquat-inducible protein A